MKTITREFIILKTEKIERLEIKSHLESLSLINNKDFDSEMNFYKLVQEQYYNDFDIKSDMKHNHVVYTLTKRIRKENK